MKLLRLIAVALLCPCLGAVTTPRVRRISQDPTFQAASGWPFLLSARDTTNRINLTIVCKTASSHLAQGVTIS